MPKTRHDNRSHRGWLNKEKAGRDAGFFVPRKRAIILRYLRALWHSTRRPKSQACVYMAEAKIVVSGGLGLDFFGVWLLSQVMLNFSSCLNPTATHFC